MPPKPINHQHQVSFTTNAGQQVQFRAMDPGYQRVSFNSANGPVTFAARTPAKRRG